MKTAKRKEFNKAPNLLNPNEPKDEKMDAIGGAMFKLLIASIIIILLIAFIIERA